MVKELNFDISRQQLPVTIKDQEGGTRSYFLVEADGEAVNTWRNAVMKGARLDREGKIVGVEGVSDTESLLVSLCLFYADNNGNLPLDPKSGEPDIRHRVPVQKIKKFPYRVQEQLHQAAMELSNLNKKEKEDNLEEMLKKREQLDKEIQTLEERQRQGLTTDEDEVKN